MRPIVRILRVEENFRYGTFGVIIVHTEAFGVTLERPDIANKRNVSCIPAQQYECKRTHSPKFGETFQIMDVPDRDHVLFHPLNIVGQTEGCIGVAEHFGKLKGDRAILNSGNTFKSFMERLSGYDEFHLTIKEYY